MNKIIRPTFFLSLIFVTAFIFAQTGPGGVGSNDGTSNLEFWYMAQNEIYSNGDLVDTIFDRSGNGRTLVAAGIERPTFVSLTAGANNMSSLTFALDDELETTYQGNSNENMTFGMMMSYTSNANLNIAIQHGGRNTMGVSNTNFYADFVGGANQTSGTTASANWTYHSKTFANSGANRLKYYINQTNTDNFTHNIENRTSNTWIGGHGTGGGTGFSGGIAEVYKFSRVLNSAEQIIIANYLAAKYNVSLAINDIYNEDNVGNGNYDYDVAGIGRVDASNLHTDAQGTGMVRILNPTGLGNNEFLIWGHDNGAAQAINTVDIPGTIQARFDRTWRVSEVNATGSAVNVGAVDMRWDLSNLGSITASDLRLLIDTDNDGVFADETPIAGATSLGGNIYQFAGVPGDVTGISNNRRFTIATINSIQTPLPVELLEFDANINGDKVDINWVTSSEINNDYFTVEKSINAKDWEEILIVGGAGNSNELREYFDVDYKPFEGLSYYRLKQTDFNGDYKYFNIVPVKYDKNNTGEGAISLLPNPVNTGETIRIEFQNIVESELFLVIRDVQGKDVYSKIFINIEDGMLVGVPIDSSIPKGVYLVIATSENQMYSQKLVIK